MDFPSDHTLITSGLTLGTGLYMSRWVITDAITAAFEIWAVFRSQKEKVKKPII